MIDPREVDEALARLADGLPDQHPDVALVAKGLAQARAAVVTMTEICNSLSRDYRNKP